MCQHLPQRTAASASIGDDHLLSDRKQRLLACGLCRQLAALVHEPKLTRVIDTSEAYADGRVCADELACGRYRALELARDRTTTPARAKFAEAVARAAAVIPPSSYSLYKTVDPAACELINGAVRGVVELLAEEGAAPRHVPSYGTVLGDLEPRAVSPCPAWRTATTVHLARQMYETRDFSAMPILADALQDAGCENEDVLNHCREVAPHFRGCWVIDLILERH